MTALDVAVMGAYFTVVIALGVAFSRTQHDASDYFLGRHGLPWWAVMLSVVATETSALTVISVPGLAARGDLTFLQLPLGYLIGRTGVALWLLPGYFRGEQETAYTRLESRFGRPTRRVASGIFMGIRALGDSVRVFATAIPLAIVTGWSIPASVIVVAAATLAYTWAGGIKAVVWVDVVQLGLYTVAGLAAVLVAAQLAGGLAPALAAAGEAGKLRVFDWTLSLNRTYTFAGAVLGGALLSAASHGTDHLIVQRLLATRDLRAARRALVGSGVVVIAQFALFLLVGTMLWAAGADDGTAQSDTLFPAFVVTSLPAGLAGLVVAGLLAAAMSTVSSSLNSLASAATHDFYASITGKRDPRHLLRVGRWLTVGWALVLTLGALAFGSRDTPVVELALQFASIIYGTLLGTYILGGISRSATQAEAMTGIVVGGIGMLGFWALSAAGIWRFGELAWPWYVPLGTVLTLGAAFGAGAVRRVLTPR